MRRKLVSVSILAELKRCLFPRDLFMQWTVASLRDHASSVVGSSLHGADIPQQEIAATFAEETPEKDPTSSVDLLREAGGEVYGDC